MSLIFPIDTPITSDFGSRLDPFNGTSSDHWALILVQKLAPMLEQVAMGLLFGKAQIKILEIQ